MRTTLVALLVLALAGCSADSRDSDAATVGRYCSYGARTEIQYLACIRHMSTHEVEAAYRARPPSQAATYAVECVDAAPEYARPLPGLCIAGP